MWESHFPEIACEERECPEESPQGGSKAVPQCRNLGYWRDTDRRWAFPNRSDHRHARLLLEQSAIASCPASAACLRNHRRRTSCLFELLRLSSHQNRCAALRE